MLLTALRRRPFFVLCLEVGIARIFDALGDLVHRPVERLRVPVVGEGAADRARA